MKALRSFAKWSAIIVGALVGYVWFSDLPEIRQTLLVLFGVAFAGFWYSTKLTSEAEERINKRIEHLHYRLDKLEQQDWQDSK